jgi:outer membrane protein OmpA-like peptidoglycan-associated protein
LPRRPLTRLLAAGIILLVLAVLALRFDVEALFLNQASVKPAMRSAAVATESAAAPATKGARAPEAQNPRTAPAEGRNSPQAGPATSPAVAGGAKVAAPPSSTFDVVRIDPDGASVFAGRAPANAEVTVFADGRPVASAKADDSGAWATVIERKFSSGEFQLSLRAKPTGPGEEKAGQSVRITIAAAKPPVMADTKPTASAPQPVKVSVPAPITFLYDEATFTDTGRKEVAALTAFLRQRGLATVTLTGHADSRGSDQYNMALSQQRLEAVARVLRDAGYTGKLVLVPKGKREPFGSAMRSGLPEEEVFQLDRRVELHASP